MSTKSQENNEANRLKKSPSTRWDEAISDAKKKIKALQYTIFVYRQRKKSGEPWPGDSATQN
jgi:hypothetical protein